MPRVIGIDPGTVSIDLCGLDDGRVFLDRSLPTAEALAHPAGIAGLLESSGPLDLVAGPSGYGLPLIHARDLTDDHFRLAYLAAAGEDGGIGGLRSLMRTLARAPVPIVLTPGVVHLPSVPPHRKVNRVDMGTADKVCAVVLALKEHAARRRCGPGEASFILLELGGAFSAAIAVAGGRIVDGLGGTSGPLGARAAGALDGEVAFLAGTVTKDRLFRGGMVDIAAASEPIAQAAYLESAIKAVAALTVSVPRPSEVIVSGRFATAPSVREELPRRLAAIAGGVSVHLLAGFTDVAKQAAQGAALLADGLAGGASAPLIDALGIREASGTVLDHLYVISVTEARRRLGLKE
jgi:predicted butyrate kinase (DUF1464 family)